MRAALLLAMALALGCTDSYLIARASLAEEETLPELELEPTVRGDTVFLELTPVVGAVDYRVYELPAPSAYGVASDGRRTVANAIYRCAGRRTVADRVDEYGALYAESLVSADGIYARSESESVLGYVFIRPGTARVPVYRLADPNGHGGYANAEWIPPRYREANSAEYVTDRAQRDALLARGFRDDGIAFYAPADGEHSVYRIEYTPGPSDGARVSFYFTDGPEHEARTSGDQSRVLDLGARFSVRSERATDSVALHRVTYHTGSMFDVLAAGEAAYQRALHQGGPVTSLTWSGLRERTTLVVEALDAGCPFPRAYVGASAADAESDASFPTATLEMLRSPETGEVFINGQHDPASRPRAIARAFIEVEPQARAPMDFEAHFDDPDELRGMTSHASETTLVQRNDRWSVETSHCGASFTLGAVLGQLFVGMPQCRFSLVPRGIASRIQAGAFLHVRMATDLPSTGRRFPQLMITTADSPEASEVEQLSQLPILNRLGPLVESQLPGAESTIVVQTHFSYHEPQIQLCAQRGWGTTAFCPRANLYGYNAGEADPELQWDDEPWRAVPVLTDRAGFDRPVQLDVYASTERVYLFVDDQPTGCAQLAAGEMPEGDVTVAFGAIIDEPEKDELVRGDPGRAYELEYSQLHSDRRFDDLGISVGVPEPQWDETRLPCATRRFGGHLVQE